MILYGLPASSYTLKVRLALDLKGIDYREVAPPGGYGSARYRDMVPAGTIPAIEHDGLVLSESSAIAEYIEEVWPEPPLLPADPAARARIRMLCAFHDTRLEPPVRALIIAARDGLPPAGRFADHLERLADRLNVLARLVAPAPFAVGERLSLADLAYPATWIVAERLTEAIGAPLAWPSSVVGWRKALADDPRTAPAIARYGEAFENWLATKRAA